MTCADCTEPYVWRVYYSDGSVFEECPSTGEPHRGFALVEKERVAALEWHPLGADHFPIRMIIPAGTMPTLFRRLRVQVFVTEERDPVRLPAIHALGWQSETGDVYVFVMPDGSVLTSTDLNAV